MHFEVDVFWVKLGGIEPIDLLQKLNNRVSQLHLKDLQKGSVCPNFGKVEPEAFEEIGDGMVPIIPTSCDWLKNWESSIAMWNRTIRLTRLKASEKVSIS